MLQQAYFFTITAAVYMLLGWSIYVNYRQGQMYNGGYLTMAMGAYFTAFALRDWGWPFGLALLGAVALGGGIAFLISLKLANAGDLAILLASLAPLFVFQVVVTNLDFLGGAKGLVAIPQVGYLLPVAIVAILVVGFLIYRLEHSRLGRAQEVIFSDPDVAATQGINAYRLSVVLQTAAGAMGGLAGAIFAPLFGVVGPGNFGIVLILNILAFFFVGGYTTMWGLAIFTPLLWALRVFLPIEAATWTMLIYGVMLIVTMIFRPDGVITKQALRSIRIKGQAFQKWVRGLRKSDIRQGTT